MRETYHHATAEAIREGLLDNVSMQQGAEAIADTLAESLARDFKMPDREVEDVAEVLVHCGLGPDEIQKAMWEAVRRLAAKAAAKLVTQPPSPELPAAAYAALVRLRVRAGRRAGVLHWLQEEEAAAS